MWPLLICHKGVYHIWIGYIAEWAQHANMQLLFIISVDLHNFSAKLHQKCNFVCFCWNPSFLDSFHHYLPKRITHFIIICQNELLKSTGTWPVRVAHNSQAYCIIQAGMYGTVLHQILYYTCRYVLHCATP